MARLGSTSRNGEIDDLLASNRQIELSNSAYKMFKKVLLKSKHGILKDLETQVQFELDSLVFRCLIEQGHETRGNSRQSRK